MNGRIFLLIAMTGLFVHVWNVNDPAKRGKIAVRTVTPRNPVLSAPHEESTEKPQVELSLDSSHGGRDDVVAPVNQVPTVDDRDHFPIDPAVSAPHRDRPVSSTRIVSTPSAVPVSVEPRLMPEALPMGIACGLYQVVDNFGHMCLVQISPDRLLQQGLPVDVAVRDMYVHREGNQRWYFIRQGTTEETVQRPAAALPGASLVSAPVVSPKSVMPESAAAPTVAGAEIALPMALRPTNLVRRQELAMQATAEKSVMAKIEETSPINWNRVISRFDRVGHRLQTVAARMLSRWPAAAQWLPEGEMLPTIQVLPQVNAPSVEAEVELPTIPLFRTAQPDRPSPM